MNKESRRNLIDTLDSLYEMISYVSISNKNFHYLELCVETIISIRNRIKNSKIMNSDIEKIIIQIEDEVIVHNNKELFRFEIILKYIENLKKLIKDLDNLKPVIIFMPYKFSMWDSLKSIYEEALESAEFSVYLMPLPYYEFDHENKRHYVYEGEKFKEEDYYITDYKNMNLMYESPDIIFLHNIYDGYNTLTMIDENYHTEKLQEINSKIIYVPYYMSSFIPFEKEDGFYPYSLPSIDRIDEYIVMNKFELNIAKKERKNSEKFISLGSPKLDYVKEEVRKINLQNINQLRINNSEDKKSVYFLDTGCLFFAADPFRAYKKILDILNIPKYSKNTKVIWRPHPLMLASIKKYTPYLISIINELLDDISNSDNHYFPGVYIDNNKSYIESLLKSDIYIGKNSSLMNLAVFLNKDILVLDNDFPARCLISKERFTFLKEDSVYNYLTAMNQEKKIITNQKIFDEIFNDSNLSSGKRIINYVKEKYFQPIQ